MSLAFTSCHIIVEKLLIFHRYLGPDIYLMVVLTQNLDEQKYTMLALKYLYKEIDSEQ
jgi:hypothetical protein